MGIEMRELLAKINALSALEQMDWFRENPEEACRLYWYVLRLLTIKAAQEENK